MLRLVLNAVAPAAAAVGESGTPPPAVPSGRWRRRKQFKDMMRFRYRILNKHFCNTSSSSWTTNV